MSDSSEISLFIAMTCTATVRIARAGRIVFLNTGFKLPRNADTIPAVGIEKIEHNNLPAKVIEADLFSRLQLRAGERRGNFLCAQHVRF